MYLFMKERTEPEDHFGTGYAMDQTLDLMPESPMLSPLHHLPGFHKYILNFMFQVLCRKKNKLVEKEK